VLFNARLCGIIAGIQVGMIGVLVAGYRLPIPWGVALVVTLLPVAGYLLAGWAVQSTPASWHPNLLVGGLSGNVGLLVALVAAILGAVDPAFLGGLTVVVAALLWPVIRRAVTASSQEGTE